MELVSAEDQNLLSAQTSLLACKTSNSANETHPPSPSAPFSDSTDQSLPPMVRRRIQKNFIMQLRCKLGGYIRARMNHLVAKQALAETYVLTHDLLKPSFPPFRSHILSTKDRLLDLSFVELSNGQNASDSFNVENAACVREKKCWVGVARFRVTEKDFREIERQIRMPRRMKIKELLQVLEEVINKRKNLNLIWVAQKNWTFDFSLTTELYQTLNKCFQIEKRLKKIEKIEDPLEKEKTAQEMKVFIFNSIRCLVSEHFGISEKDALEFAATEFDLRRIF